MIWLFGLLALSVTAILVTVIALRWRLGWHLRRPDKSPPHAVTEIQPEHETLEQK
jgi:hypothetical protein